MSKTCKNLNYNKQEKINYPKWLIFGSNFYDHKRGGSRIKWRDDLNIYTSKFGLKYILKEITMIPIREP